MMLAAIDLIDTLFVIGLVGLFFVVVVVPEVIADRWNRRRHPEREARRLRYKPVWTFAGILAGNIAILAALILSGDGAAALAAGVLLCAYGIFRYFLMRSAEMQQRFLRRPPPSTTPGQ